MKILFVAADLSQGGGVNRVIVNLANIMSTALHYNVTVLSGRSKKKSSYLIEQSVAVKSSNYITDSLFNYVRDLLRCRTEDYDFVISFWPQDNILTALCFVLSGTRVIVCEHTSYFHSPRYIAVLRTLIYNLANCIVVLNKRELLHYSTFNCVKLIPNPININADADSTRASREKLILAVGHLIDRKGFSDLIDAFERADISEEGWQLIVIGQGPLLHSLKHQAEGTHCKTNISFFEPTSRLNEWYKKASIIAVPSSIEVFSMVLAEAMSYGVIPVGYRADGPVELLADFPDCLVDIGDVNALSRRIRFAAAEQHLNGELRLKLRQSVLDRCSPEIVARLWCDMFTQMVGSA